MANKKIVLKALNAKKFLSVNKIANKIWDKYSDQISELHFENLSHNIYGVLDRLEEDGLVLVDRRHYPIQVKKL